MSATQTNTVSASGRDVGEVAVHERLGLLVDDLDEHFDRTLEFAGHAGRGAPRREA